MADGTRVKVAVVVALVVAGVAIPTGVAIERSRHGIPVVVVGDSITAMSKGDIETALGADEVAIEATFGATVADMLPAARDLASKRPEQAVINLGSNDALRGLDPGLTEEDYRLMIAEFKGARCVHLVNISTLITVLSISHERQAVAVNDIIGRLAAEDRERIDIVDWNAAVVADAADHGGRSSLIADNVHPNEAGMRVLADLIRDATSRCAPA